MKYLSLILSLATAATAIDSIIYFEQQCIGNWAGCLNLNPGECCYLPATIGKSARYNAVPGDWDLVTSYDKYTSCPAELPSGGAAIASSGSLGREFCQVPYNEVGSIKYMFGKVEANMKNPPEWFQAGTKAVDILGLADGRQYGLAAMEDVLAERLLRHASGDAPLLGEELETVFKRYLIWGR